jgi:endonuclease/exonuclease/phosphatase family metal-dependent hydrolase
VVERPRLADARRRAGPRRLTLTPRGVTTLRVLTCNIHSATDVLGRGRLVEQGAMLRAEAPDIVLLQEVRRGVVDQAQELARLACLPHVAYGAVWHAGQDDFGNAILSRWPLAEVSSHPVPLTMMAARVWAQQRGVLAATVEVPAESRPLPVKLMATHFGLLPGDGRPAARLILDLAAAWSGALIVGGDLNRPAGLGDFHRLLRTALIDCGAHDGRPLPTFPSAWPVLRLDYLYARDVSVRGVHVPNTRVSDHRPLVANVELDAT